MATLQDKCRNDRSG